MLDFLADNWQTLMTLLFGSGCGILYFKQDKMSKSISNVAAASEEWQKLLNERKEECTRLNAKIDQVYEEKDELRKKLDQTIDKGLSEAYYKGLYESSRCDVWECPKRRPPLKPLLDETHSPEE